MRFLSVFSFLLMIGLLFGCADEEGGVLLGSIVDTSSDVSLYKALRFDGAIDYIGETSSGFPMIATNGGSFTFAVWLKPNAVATMGIFSLWGSATDRFDIIMTGAKQLEMVSNDISNTHTYTSAGTLNVDQSNFFAIVYNSGVASIYINGAAVETPGEIGTQTFASGGPNIYIGTDSNTTDFFSGDIHSVAYWNITMPGTAITEIYNSGTPGFDLTVDQGNYTYKSGLQNWWKLGDHETQIGMDSGQFPINLTAGTLSSIDIVPFP